MLRAPSGEMLDLLPARDAGGHDLGLGVRRLDGGGQPSIPEGDRDVVVLCLEAERSGHAAAARVDLAHLEPGPLERGDRRARADHGLLMAVPVEQRSAHGPGAVLERETEPATALTNEELLEEHARPRDLSRLLRAHQLDVLVAQREETGWLETDDRHAARRERREPRHVPLGVRLRLVEHALRDEGTPAAFLVDELDAIAGGLQELHRGAP